MGTATRVTRATRVGKIVIGTVRLIGGTVAFILLAAALIYFHPQQVKIRMALAACPQVERALIGDPRWEVSVSSSTSGHVQVYGQAHAEHLAELRRRAILAAGNVPVQFSLSAYRDPAHDITPDRTITASASTSAQ